MFQPAENLSIPNNLKEITFDSLQDLFISLTNNQGNYVQITM